MTPPVDQATRDLVSLEGLHRTLFVEAGAGTGKTTQLVDRIANLVLEHGVRLANVAAITFTEAAAAELQTRIRVRFEQRAATTDDDAERTRCREAIADADLAAISTLHGFANRLLGEFAIAAGLPPRVSVLDEVSSQLAHEERWARFVDELYDDPVHHAVLARASVLDIPLEPRYHGQRTLQDVAFELNEHWDRLDRVVDLDPTPITPVDFTRFDETVAAVVELPDLCSDPDDKFCLHLTEVLIPQMRMVASIADPDRKLRVLAGKLGWGPGGGGRNDAWGGDAKAAKQRVKDVVEAVADLIRTSSDQVLRHLLVLIAREVRAAADARRRDGGLEFHDLLVLARRLLRERADARDTLHERYTHILLDEFQDTDRIQVEMAILIAASIVGAAPDAHWRTLPVDDGRLFFVGDPKQSIYRFRRADISLFLEARDHFGPNETWERLTTNFRTVAPILEWVNAYFSHAMSAEEPGRQPRYEPLQPSRQAETAADHRPLLLGGPHPDPKVLAGVLREEEAADVARTIAAIRDHPARWPVQDRPDEPWRPARLADVTVLVPTRTSLPYLRDALDREAIPYRLATGTLVYDTQEVRDVLAAVRAIDDPTDELSLVAALRSPLYACSDVDLFTYRQAHGRWDIRIEPPETVPVDHPVRLALDHLRSLWRERWWLTPSTVLDRLLRERRASLLAFGDPRPTEVWRRLRFVLDQARAFEEANGGDLRAFTHWAALQGADSARVHEPLLPETDDDAVSILTIHGSKGLEFPITILSGMTTLPGAGQRSLGVMWTDDGQPEVRIRKGVETTNHEPRADLEVEMDVHEKLRLLYVASTRVRDHLIVSCHHKPTTRACWGQTVWDFFAEHPDLWRSSPAPTAGGNGRSVAPVRAAAVAAPGEDVVVQERQAWIAARDALIEPQRRARVVSATTVARSVDQALADEDDDAADEADEADDAGALRVRRQGRAGSAVGRATHATLQLLDLADPRDIDAQVERQCQLESIPDLTDTVGALVRSALAADAVQQAAQRAHHKELYVAAPVGGRVIEGYVDLLVETDDGLVVVDYKTDSARSEAEIDAKLAAYELQGAAYAAALEAVTGRPVVDCRFVFCRASGAVERSVADLDAAKARVRAVLESTA
jgi:ATP-dependent exoDNAse (exonuclease V) beta subunit